VQYLGVAVSWVRLRPARDSPRRWPSQPQLGRRAAGLHVYASLAAAQVSPSAAMGACVVTGLHTGCMTEPGAPKAGWVDSFPADPPDKDGLARIVEADGGRDDAENSYYEQAADPRFVRIETARRRFRGQYLRRVKRLTNRARSRRA